MPRYEYWCGVCQKEMILVHSYKESVLECPDCSTGDQFSRVISDIKLRTNIQKTAAKGSVVKDFINKAKDEVLAEKKKLGQRQKS